MQEYKKIIDRYIDKWDKILFSTQPVDREKASKAVIDAYCAIDLPPPEIFFLSSPSLEQSQIFNSVADDDKYNDYIRLKVTLGDKLLEILEAIEPITEADLNFQVALESTPLLGANIGELFGKLCNILYEQYVYDIHCDNNMNFHKILEYELYFTNSWIYDFHINHISNNDAMRAWYILKSLCEECPYILTYEKFCLIIEKPSELYLDRELVPHAEGKAAIKYADGYELYCNHGTIIPARYGQLHPSDWRSEWILADEDNNEIGEGSEFIISVLFNISYQKFSRELPEIRERYWNNKDGLLRSYCNFIEYSFRYIFDWLNFHYSEYHVLGEDVSRDKSSYYTREIAKNFLFKLSEELVIFSNTSWGQYQLIIGLDYDPLPQTNQNFSTGLSPVKVQIFHGDRQEIYYVLCDNITRPFSHVYCQFPNQEPIIYAECISSWMATIAECYREGGYYVAIDEQSEQKEIKQDLDKIEPIFEKFNPEQIDNWRKIWR